MLASLAHHVNLILPCPASRRATSVMECMETGRPCVGQWTSQFDGARRGVSGVRRRRETADTVDILTSSPSPAGMATATADASATVEPVHRWRLVMLVNRMSLGGGAERAMVALATHLPRDRFEVTVVTTRAAEGPLVEMLAAQRIRVLALNRRGRFDVAPLHRLCTLLRDERIDILHAHMFGSNFWGTMLGRLAGVPVVVAQEHSWSYEGQPVRRFLDGRVIGRLCEAFVALSKRDREGM
jgi:hypothetical protein